MLCFWELLTACSYFKMPPNNRPSSIPLLFFSCVKGTECILSWLNISEIVSQDTKVNYGRFGIDILLSPFIPLNWCKICLNCIFRENWKSMSFLNLLSTVRISTLKLCPQRKAFQNLVLPSLRKSAALRACIFNYWKYKVPWLETDYKKKFCRNKWKNKYDPTITGSTDLFVPVKCVAFAFLIVLSALSCSQVSTITDSK